MKEKTILFQYNIDSYGNPTSTKIKEVAQVSPLKYTIQLEQIPDEQFGVTLLNEDNTSMFQVFNYDDVEKTENSYYVNYTNGLIYFNSKQGAEKKIINYYGTGIELISCKRVFDGHYDANGKWVVEILQEIIDAGREAIEAMNTIGDASIILQNLSEKIAEGNIVIEEIKELKQEIAQAINVTGNEVVIINAGDWVYNPTNKMYEYTINHTMNSKDLIIDCYNLATGDFVLCGGKIVNNNSILIKSETNIDLKVVLNARYYKATLTISDDIAREVVEARKTHETVGERLDDFDLQLEHITKIKIYTDIADTDYKAGFPFDLSYLKTIQLQKLALFYRKLRTGEPVRFCHRGDSLTYGYDVVSSDKRGNSVTFADGSTYDKTIASKTYPEAMEEFLKQVYGGDKILPHINRGCGGDYASASLTRHNKKHDGDITLLMLGTNDSRNGSCPYKGDVKKYLYWMEQIIIQELLWGKPVILLKSPCVQLENDLNVDTFSSAIDLLGKKYGIPVIDTQEIMEGYGYEIWSDVTHFNGDGYCVLGVRLGTCFIGEGLLNIPHIKSGSILPITPMRGSIIMNANCTYGNTTDGDYANGYTNTKGYQVTLNNSSAKLTFSFYTEEENIYIMPSMWLRGDCGVKVSLDNNVSASENILDSSILINRKNNDGNATYKEIYAPSGYAIRVNKLYYKDSLLEPLRIPNKGYHSVTIEAINPTGQSSSIGYLMGVEFINFNDLYTLFEARKNKPTLIYNNETGSDLKIGDIITVDNLNIYDTLIIGTGRVGNDSFMTSICKNFNGKFNTNSLINVATNDGKLKGLVRSDNTIEITQIDNPLRYIYGVIKFD